MSEPSQNPLSLTSSCLQQCWAPAVRGLWHVCPNIPSQPLRGFSASLEWSLLERRLWTVWATDTISPTLQILQGGVWEEHFFSPALTSWLITQEALFSANKTVLVFSCCEPDVPNSFFFDQCSTMCLKANLLQFTKDENHHLNGSCRFLFSLKIIYLKGENLRNCIMPGENISDGFFAKMIQTGKIWKRKQRINPGKGSCLKRTSAVAKAISGGCWFKSENLKWLSEEVSRKWTISSVLFSCQSNRVYTGLVSQTTEVKTPHLMWCGGTSVAGSCIKLLFV